MMVNFQLNHIHNIKYDKLCIMIKVICLILAKTVNFIFFVYIYSPNFATLSLNLIHRQRKSNTLNIKIF